MSTAGGTLDAVDGLRVVSYGGGVQSTALLVLAARGYVDFPTFLFANVGDDSEDKRTLRYVREVAFDYAAAHGIRMEELHRRCPRSRRAGSARSTVLTRADCETVIRSAGLPGTTTRGTAAVTSATPNPWRLSDRCDPAGKPIADRHYNRQHPDSPNFVPPGACLVLHTEGALWVTSWPLAQYVKHDWGGAWINSTFRNERPDLHLSSTLIRHAVAATRHKWPLITPTLGMVTFINPTKVRRKRDPGYCYLKAGFHPAGHTRGGFVALQLDPPDMPDPEPPAHAQDTLF